MYKSIIFFSIHKDVPKLFVLKSFANKHKLKMQVCRNEKEFITKFNKYSLVIYNKSEQEQIKNIQKKLSFLKINIATMENFEQVFHKGTHNYNMPITSKLGVTGFFDAIHMYSNNISAVILKQVLKNTINFGVRFNYKIFNITCKQLGVDFKTQISATRKYIRDWMQESNAAKVDFKSFYSFEKVTISNFLNCALNHFYEYIREKHSVCEYYNCEYYLNKIYESRINKIKNIPFFKIINSKLKIKLYYE